MSNDKPTTFGTASKPPSDKAVVAKVCQGIPVLALGHKPTPEQRELKAAFWLAFKSNPIADHDQVSPALVEQVTGRSVQSWLAVPSFWAWFTVKDQVKLTLEVAAERAAELALLYLDPAMPMNDNARVQLIKYVLEFSGRSPPLHKVVKWADKDVGDMTEQELEDYIRKRTATRLPAATPKG